LKKQQRKYIELLIIIGSILLSLFLWDTIIILPIKLFVVLLHEISHAIAAILSGGSVISLKISEQLGGVCSTSGGNNFIIASAGYLGSFVFGAVLFYSGYETKKMYWINIFIAVTLLLFAANFIDGLLGIFIAFFYSALLMIMPKLPMKNFYSYLIKILGLISCVYVLFDIKEDLFSSTNQTTDAQLLADLTSIPAVYWAVLWLAVSAAGIYFLIRFAYNKGFRKLR